MKKLFRGLSFTLGFLFLFIIIGNLITNLSLWFLYDETFKVEQSKKINNIDISYKIIGSGNPILLIHDFFNSSLEFEELANKLSQTNKVVLIDLPGFGLSSKNDNFDYSKNNLSKTCNELMNTLGYKKYSILGHGVGGEIALQTALNFPADIDKLILDAPTVFYPKEKTIMPNIIFKAIYMNYFSQLFFEYNSFYNKDSFDFASFEKNYYLNSKQSALIFKKIKLEYSPISEETIKSIKTPTLILWGMGDKVVPLSNSTKLNDSLGASKLILFSNTGHNPHIEQPELFLKEVLKFLNTP